jgi:hypothetical protein
MNECFDIDVLFVTDETGLHTMRMHPGCIRIVYYVFITDCIQTLQLSFWAEVSVLSIPVIGPKFKNILRDLNFRDVLHCRHQRARKGSGSVLRMVAS